MPQSSKPSFSALRPRSSLLLEVVLFTPIENSLLPFLSDVTNEAVKQWFLTNFRNWLMKQPSEMHKLTYAPPSATEKQKKAFSFDDLWEVRLTPGMQTLIGHLLDFFDANPNLPRLDRMSVENVEAAADQWVKQMHERAKKMKEDPKEVKTLMEFPNGYRMVELLGGNALDKEGQNMGHCVGGYCDHVKSGRLKIFSLRDRDNQPHATIELGTSDNETRQIKGKRNMAPVRRYWSMIREFLESIKSSITGDYMNVGLLRIEDDTGQSVTMTQDEFRDLILDPASDKGQKYLTQDTLRRMSADEVIGLFNAFYGSERMTDDLVQRAFDKAPDLAIQTVAHYGNKLTPSQVVVAFAAIERRRFVRDNSQVEDLMRLVKPDVALAKAVIERVDQADGFMVALAQEMPEIYAELLGNSEQVMMAELSSQSERSAAPFFVFADTDKLTPTMIDRAFAYKPVDAMKRVAKLGLDMTGENFKQPLNGLSQSYRDNDDVLKSLDGLFAYAKPNAAALENVFADYQYSGEFAAKVLKAAQDHVPESLTKEVIESALITIADKHAYRDYFKRVAKPGDEVQQHLFSSSYGLDLLHYVQVIDPALFKLAHEKLKPKAVSDTTQDFKNYKKKDSTYFQKKVMKPKEPDDIAKEKAQAIRAATHDFRKFLDPLLREPDQDQADPIDLDSPKAAAALKGFSAFKKGPLLKLAVDYINRTNAVDDIKGNAHYTQPNLEKFAKQVDGMRIKDIESILDKGRGNSAFGTFINNAPQRMAELLKYWMKKHPTTFPWGDFKQPVEKDKAYLALETVWASNLADGYKDSFAEVVLKRFKPSPASLLDMLEKADNEEVTRKILMKTKNPSAALVDWVMDGFPQLVLDIKKIPPESLAKIFQQDRYVRALMDRDLRGYGSDGRSKWATKRFGKKIDRESDVFAEYAKAAKAAGKEDAFEKYVHQAELDEKLDRRGTDDRLPKEEILSKLDEYSNDSLVRILRDDHKDSTMLPLFFKRFSPKKMAALIMKGALGEHYSYHGTPDISLKNIDGSKLVSVLQAIMANKNVKGNQGASRLLDIMLKDKFPFDDKLIINILESEIDLGFGSQKKMLIGKLKTEAGKDWVADHLPHDIHDITGSPTSHVIETIFAQFAHWRDDKKDRHEVPYFFNSMIEHYFKTNRYGGQVKANPIALKLIKNEALKRGGDALKMTRVVLQRLSAEKAKQASASQESGDEDDRAEAREDEMA